MAYIIEWTEANVIVKFQGVLTKKDILEADDKIYGNPKFDKMKYQIFDYTGVENVDLTESDIEIIGILDKNSAIWNNRVKIAVVTTNPKITTLAGTYSKMLMGTKWQVLVFNNFEEAQEWCNF